MATAMHADKPEYGWWERKRNSPEMPTTLAYANNPVLRAVELAEYEEALLDLYTTVKAEYDNVRYTSSALAHGRLPLYEGRIPRMFTLCDVLNFVVAQGRTTLRIMQLLKYVARERNNRLGEGDEGHASVAGAVAAGDQP